VSKEEVHGSVEVRINPDHQDHHQISHQSQKINHQEQHKEHDLDLRVIGKSPKDKLRNETDIFHGYRFCPPIEMYGSPFDGTLI
jgi:hypothetical protein